MNEYTTEQAEVLLRIAEAQIPGSLAAWETAARKHGLWPDGEDE